MIVAQPIFNASNDCMLYLISAVFENLLQSMCLHKWRKNPVLAKVLAFVTTSIAAMLPEALKC